MNSRSDSTATGPRHEGPHPGIVAAVYVVLKIGSVYPVSSFGSKPPYFPNLNASTETVVSYFSTHSAVVLLSAFLQVGAAIPFAIFAACMLSRFCFFGATAAGPWIAFTGGAIAAIDELASGAAIAVMAQPLVAQNGPLVQAFHYFSVALGGPGFTMPFGLLMAGISIAGGVMKIVPKWLVAFGLVLAVVGELSWLSMVFPRMGLLIPLARWPGFIWLIAAGFAVPNRLSVRDGA